MIRASRSLAAIRNDLAMTARYKSVELIPTVDTSLPSFDNTQLVGINTCPTWGTIRYVHHKAMGKNKRAMALEAGQAAHDGFAAHRLFYLLEYGNEYYGRDVVPAVMAHGLKLFGDQRWDEILTEYHKPDDERRRLINVMLTALATSGFYDDPDDKRRTVSNIEEMLIAYADRIDLRRRMPVIIGDFVGVELGFDTTIKFVPLDKDDPMVYRFIGRIDGIHYHHRANGNIVTEIQDNKTASRLDDAWEMSYLLSNQVTGYMLAAKTAYGIDVTNARIIGTALPLPRNYDYGGIANVDATRSASSFAKWFDWVYDTLLIRRQWEASPLEAPRYTHSCNRYFRVCPFIYLCATEGEEQQHVFDNMVTDEWSPLEDGHD